VAYFWATLYIQRKNRGLKLILKPVIVLQSAVNEATFEVLYNALMVTKTQLC